MKNLTLPILLVLVVAFTVPGNAYVLYDHKWPSPETTFNVDIPGGNGLWNRAFEEAMNRWNQATIFNFRIRHTYENPCDSPDGLNGVAFAADFCGEAFGENVLAAARSWSLGNITTQSDIIFNNAYTWNVYDGPYGAGGGAHDFRRLAVHELGHALGLGHEESARAIMHPAPPPPPPPKITHKYIFPQFAFGGGWQSTLMALGPHKDTSCTFSAQGRYLETDGPQGTELNLSFDNTWMLLRTTAPATRAASSGMAVLHCDKEVLANVLFSLRVNGSVVGEALVEPAEEINIGDAYFISDHKGGGRLALAIANPWYGTASVSVRVVSDSYNSPPSSVDTTIDIPANSAKSFFLDEVGTIPENHVGLVQISVGLPPVHVIGLKFTGSVFTTIPAMVVR